MNPDNSTPRTPAARRRAAPISPVLAAFLARVGRESKTKVAGWRRRDLPTLRIGYAAGWGDCETYIKQQAAESEVQDTGPHEAILVEENA